MAKRLTTRLSAGAALVTGLGMVGIAAATPAQADVTKDLEYTCEVSDLGIKFKDPWQVNLTVGVEEQYDQGAEIAAPDITAEVTPGEDAAEQMTSLGIESLEGDATAKYTFGETQREAELTVPKTEVENGTITTVATGTGSTETAPDEDVNVPITAGNFTAKLTAQSGFVLNLACEAPEDNAVGTVAIGDAEPPTEEPEATTPEANDWFTEPASLPLVDNTFTVEGDATQAGVITVQVLGGTTDADGEPAPGEVLKTYTMDAQEGANTADFDLVEGADYVRLLSQDCVDAEGRTEEEAGGCNVTYRAPWANDGNNDEGEQVADDAPAEPEAPAEPDAPAEPEVPAVVQTDGLTPATPQQDDNTAALALGGLLFAGAGAGTILVTRRRAAAQH